MSSVKSATLKRLLKEKQLMEANPCCEFHAEISETNALEWHFTMQGPKDSPYEHGYYHGRILVPSDYPFKPPDVVLLTPNGRFELDKRICLSISSYHPENWHPTWGIHTVLHALREFMLTPGNNAIGAIEYPRLVREDLARRSVDFVCPGCGCKVSEVRDRMMQCPPAAASPASVGSAAAPLSPGNNGAPLSPSPSVPPSAAATAVTSPMLLPSASEPSHDDMPVTATLESATAAHDNNNDVSSSREPSTNTPAGPVREEAAVDPAEADTDRAAVGGADVMAQPTAAPAVAPVAPPAPQAVAQPQRLVEIQGGHLVFNVSLSSVDRAIHSLLVTLLVILVKKVVCVYWTSWWGTADPDL